jgi:hypothetical protein
VAIPAAAASVSNTPKNIANNRLSTWTLADFGGFSDDLTLIAWRRQSGSYPRVPFADVFAQAEGGKPRQHVPSFAGKVVLIGATAPSLHDIHPTPLSPLQPGVDTLATAIDNALNARHLTELPRAVQAAIAVALCLGLAAWVQRRGIASLDAALLLLPGALLGVSYLTLNGSPVFVDLGLSAGIALLMLTALRTWNGWRRNHWCNLPFDDETPSAASPAGAQGWHLMALQSRHALADSDLDRVIDALAKSAPQARLVCADATATWPNRLRWPELAHNAGVVGPLAQLQRLQDAASRYTRRDAAYGLRFGVPLALAEGATRDSIAQQTLLACHRLMAQSDASVAA